MTDIPLPAVALAAVPGRRKATLELAREIERRGFSGIYCATYGDGVGLCEALALVTERIPLGRPQTPEDIGQTVVFLAGADNITGQAVNVDGGILMQ